MTIEIINNIYKLTAEPDMAIRLKDGSIGLKTMITETWISPSDSPDNWEDCERGEGVISDDATEADKDAALETLGVDMTED